MDPTGYLLAVGDRESQWTRRFGEPLENKFPFNSLIEGKVNPDDHLKLLAKYQSIAPYLLPNNPESPFNRPILRHPGNYCITYLRICTAS